MAPMKKTSEAPKAFALWRNWATLASEWRSSNIDGLFCLTHGILSVLHIYLIYIILYYRSSELYRDRSRSHASWTAASEGKRRSMSGRLPHRSELP